MIFEAFLNHISHLLTKACVLLRCRNSTKQLCPLTACDSRRWVWIEIVISSDNRRPNLVCPRAILSSVPTIVPFVPNHLLILLALAQLCNMNRWPFQCWNLPLSVGVAGGNRLHWRIGCCYVSSHRLERRKISKSIERRSSQLYLFF